MILATMMRKTKLSSIIRITGEINAQMKCVAGLRKHLYNEWLVNFRDVNRQCKLTPLHSHNVVFHQEQILKGVSEPPSRAEGCHNWPK